MDGGVGGSDEHEDTGGGVSARPPSGCATPPKRSAWCGLRELGAAAPAEGGNGFAYGWLMRDEQARAERVEAQLDSAWATLRRRARALTR